MATSASANMVNSKRQKHCSEDQNRITNLPDQVLVHILSLLPTKDAAKMMLIPKFRDLWSYIHTLSFDHCSYHDCEFDGATYNVNFINFVQHMLVLHESRTLCEFRLKIYFSHFHSKSDESDEDDVREEKKMGDAIGTWLLFAIRKNVKVIKLNFYGCGGENPGCNYELPSFVLNSDCLEELKLNCCDIKPKRLVHLNSLVKLSFWRAMLSEKIIDELLSGCPSLEELYLNYCYGLRKLSFISSNVKKLVIMQDRLHYTPRLEISCPDIKSLYLSGWIEHVDLINVSSLNYANISFTSNMKLARKKYDEIRLLMEKLGEVKVFVPCQWCILALTIRKLLNLPCPPFNWTRLEFDIVPSKWHFLGLYSLLKNSISLETLILYIKPSCYDVFQGQGEWLRALDIESIYTDNWNSQGTTFHCLKHHLKTVMIYGAITEQIVLQFLEFLLKNAMTLEKLVIDSKKRFRYCEIKELTSDHLLQISQKLLTIPRASTRATIYLT